MVPSVHGLRLATLAILPASLIVITALRQFIANRQHKPLPPGPKPLPVLGNILSIDAQEPWLTYAEWRDAYGTGKHWLAQILRKLFNQGTWFSFEFWTRKWSLSILSMLQKTYWTSVLGFTPIDHT
jgi:hypothetical protein